MGRKPGPKRKASLKEKSKNASAVEEKSKPASVKRIKLTKEKDSKVSAEKEEKQITKKGQKEKTIEGDFNDLFKEASKSKKDPTATNQAYSRDIFWWRVVEKINLNNILSKMKS